MKEFLDPEIEAYAAQHSMPESVICRELREETERTMELARMLVGPYEAAFLKMMVRLVRARRVLEIGMFTGYSALSMAEALPADGAVITCEIDSEPIAVARRYFAKSPHGRKIEVKPGPALETLQREPGPFDLIFIDADKQNYLNYYRRALELLAPTGVILIDNVLWSGDVLHQPPLDERTAAIQELNRTVASDPRVTCVLVPVRDGVLVISPARREEILLDGTRHRLLSPRVMGSPSSALAYAALTVSAIVWGGSIVAQKYALSSFSAVEVSVLRGLGALAILIPLWWVQEGVAIKLTGRDLRILGVLGVAVLGNHLLTLFGLRYIGAAAAGVIIGASPAITALLSSLLVRDVPFSKVAAGCVVSFAGVALVSGVGGDASAGESPWLGGTLVLLGLVSWALYTIGSGSIMGRLSPLTVNWTTLAISLLLQIPLLWTDQQVMQSGLADVPAGGWLSLVYLIVFATALGQQAWLYGVHGVGPSRAGVFVNLIPVSALLLSAAVLGETIGVKEMTGILLILAGVWLVSHQTADRLK